MGGIIGKKKKKKKRALDRRLAEVIRNLSGMGIGGLL